MRAQGRLAVVIPHHSRRDLLGDALAAVSGLPVFLVDDSPAGLGGTAPSSDTVAIRTRGEEGFARAANRGLEAASEAGFPWVLLLNDDASPHRGCVETLVDVAMAEPSIGAAGPVLLDHRGRVESAGIRVHRHTARVRQRRRVPGGIRDVDALSGACMLLASDQRFDQRYRFGFEDVDLCRRLRAAGRRVVLVPTARCDHAGGATLSRRSPEATRHALAGHLTLVEDRPWLRPLVLAMAAAQVLREGGPPARLRGLLEGWRDAPGRRTG